MEKQARSQQKVLDYKGQPILKTSARKIKGQYYEEGVTCIKMEDEKWYRVNTGRIIFDYENKKWWFTEEAPLLCSGIIDVLPVETPIMGTFKATYKNVVIAQLVGGAVLCINSDIAEKMGYVENYADGKFVPKALFNPRNFKPVEPPSGARTQTYSLDDDLATKNRLIDNYNRLTTKIDKLAFAIEKRVPYSFGVEAETSLGFLPDRLAHNIGVRGLRDGSVGGIEYVTVPLKGAKGIQVINLMFDELTKRTAIDDRCSLHIHFGNVRRDKLYVISLWTLFTKIQDELCLSFPYSRTNKISAERKVYCKKLPDLALNVNDLVCSKSKAGFQTILVNEFNKIYKFLNSTQEGESRKPGDVISKQLVRVENNNEEESTWKLREQLNVFSTKTTKHVVTGQKWTRPTRYYAINFLPLFFSNAHTIEFRLHEATTNFSKTMMWLLICSALLQAAEDFNFVFNNDPSLYTVFKHVYGDHIAKYLSNYLLERQAIFCDKTSSGVVWKTSWDKTENVWLTQDKKLKYDLSWLI